MHVTPLGFQVPQSCSYGQRQGHSLDQLPPHNLPAGSIPHLRFSTTGYTPSHGQYQAQVDHWRGRAYTPSGSREVVLPTLTDTIRDLDAHSTIRDIRSEVIHVITAKLQEFTRGTMFTFNLSDPTALNLRNISAKMNVDMDCPTLDQRSAYFYPSCIKTNKKTSQRHFVKPATPFKVMLVISSEEWQKWETAYESNEDANDLVNPPSQQQSFGPKTTQSFRAPSYTAQETHLSLAPSAANQPEQNNEESMVVTPPQAKKSLTWSSPTRDQVIGVLAQGGSLASDIVQSSTALLGFYAGIPDVSFADIIPKNAEVQFEFNLFKTDVPVSLSTNLSVEGELGAGGFKTCHPAKIHFPGNVMKAESIVLKEMYTAKRQNPSRQARMSGSLEFSKIMTEANIHYYANALMQFTFSYVEEKLKEKGPPSFEIPHLQFVEAGVFLIMPKDLKHSKAEYVAPE
ncbi:hypothetical protein GYMLUDRAFT_244206 [Collybiopsis luxurians FD-317 M1]|uniref:Uncharacterized protein n=1 Tax=Collybiopsis luxurians FD-317 M1 TaxID=944289 RepID=A0A0D0CWV7_9AGAR|nr:hypothetical protein GYMLUDRAFT_244206 [Collybiopsis luxurians FD-317 M1]